MNKSNFPENLEECYAALEKELTTDEIQKFQSGTEKEVVQYHHGLGRWMRNTWGLWAGGPLKDYFKEMGLWHPDDMSGVILNSFYRKLNNQPLDLSKQVEHYQRYWATNYPNAQREAEEAEQKL